MTCKHPPEYLVEETVGSLRFVAGDVVDTEQVIVTCT
jgi:hypothetical protein